MQKDDVVTVSFRYPSGAAADTKPTRIQVKPKQPIRVVLKEYTAHHNQHLPQRARNLRPPAAAGSTPAAITRLATAQIRYRRVLGGLFERPRLAVHAVSGAGRP